MKKIISLFIAVLLLFSCLAVSVSAGESFFDAKEVHYEGFEEDYTTVIDKKEKITFSANYKTLYVGKDKYVSFSNENIYDNVYADLENKISLTKKQKAETKEIFLYANESGILIDAEIEFTDGSSLFVHFIKEKYLSECKNILENIPATCTIELYYPENNTVTVTSNNLWGEKKVFYDAESSIKDYFFVLSQTKDKKLTISTGYLLLINDDFYYFNFLENNTNYLYCDVYGLDKITVHKIEDPETLQALEKAKTLYYEEDLGYLLDGDFTQTVADVFLIVIFAVLPLAALVVFIILSIKSRGIYRKINILTSVLLTGELIIFTVITLLVN